MKEGLFGALVGEQRMTPPSFLWDLNLGTWELGKLKGDELKWERASRIGDAPSVPIFMVQRVWMNRSCTLQPSMWSSGRCEYKGASRVQYVRSVYEG